MLKLLALSSLSLSYALQGNATALCEALLDAASCGGTGVAQFASPPALTECANLFTTAVPALGNDNETTGNTIGCRQYWANQAKNSTNKYMCKFAGFTGGGVCQDGAGPGVLTAACNAIDAACNGGADYPYANAAECVSELGPQGDGSFRLAAIWGSNQGPAAANENSLECRVYHALVGWQNGGTKNFHCGHVTFNSNSTFCGGPNVATHPEHYCTTVLSSPCTTTAQYANMAMCVNSIKTFPDANATATESGNNRGCRQYHAQAAVTLNDASHCYHAGPSGGNVCGGAGSSRQAWLTMTNNSNCGGNNSWVRQTVAAAFANWNSTDLLQVVPAGNAAQYNTTNFLSTNTDLCRLYHLTVATADATHCPHGGIVTREQCGNTSTIVCLAIRQGCPANYADQAACEADIAPLLARPGDPTSMVAATEDTLQCRLVHAGAALAAKNMGGNTSVSCGNAKGNGSVACVAAAPTTAPTTSSAGMLGASLMVLIPSLWM